MDRNLDGGSFKPVALGQSQKVKRARPFLVTHDKGGEKPRASDKPRPSDFKTALRFGSYKLIKFHGGVEGGHIELYDLVEDIGEDHNLATSEPERASQLEKKLDAYLKEVGGKTELPEKEKKRKR